MQSLIGDLRAFMVRSTRPVKPKKKGKNGRKKKKRTGRLAPMVVPRVAVQRLAADQARTRAGRARVARAKGRTKPPPAHVETRSVTGLRYSLRVQPGGDVVAYGEHGEIIGQFKTNADARRIASIYLKEYDAELARTQDVNEASRLAHRYARTQHRKMAVRAQQQPGGISPAT
jgi:hypothetical protein